MLNTCLQRNESRRVVIPDKYLKRKDRNNRENKTGFKTGLTKGTCWTIKSKRILYRSHKPDYETFQTSNL